MNRPIKKITHDGVFIDLDLTARNQSFTDLQYYFSKVFDAFSILNPQQNLVLKATWINTVLGPMLAISDDNALYLLEFITRRGLQKEVGRLIARGFNIISGDTSPIQSITQELTDYFSGTLMQFKTPYHVFGSNFQQEAWRALCKIPYGQTKSYLEQAIDLGRPKSYRAVANANGANRLAIIIPCHRIIASDGKLGGYGGGLSVKKWLLDHEKKMIMI